MSDIPEKPIEFEEAVGVLGTDYPMHKPFVQKEEDGFYAIITPNTRHVITRITFTKLCTEACITAHDGCFVPTARCVALAREFR
jgi:hypothetical protein